MHLPVSRLCKPEEYSYVTIMRDPVERVWSHYQMAQREPDLPYHHFSLNGLECFLTHCWEVRNMACRYYSGQVSEEPNTQNLITALHNLENFRYVLDFNNFNEEIENMLSDFNMPKPLPHKQKSSYTRPNKNECDLIKRFNRLDIELFNAWQALQHGINVGDLFDINESVD